MEVLGREKGASECARVRRVMGHDVQKRKTKEFTEKFSSGMDFCLFPHSAFHI